MDARRLVARARRVSRLSVRHPASFAPFEPMTEADASHYRTLVLAALNEDAAASDVTTSAVVDADATATALARTRAEGVIAGLAIAALAMRLVDARIRTEFLTTDGCQVRAGSGAARFEGPARGILSAERVALNLVARLSGIATLTRKFVDAVHGLDVKILDTRKTTPGLRSLERYAVRAGGGFNHRFDLSAALLIKDNHLAVAGSVGKAVERARTQAGRDRIIEVECESLADVREALAAGADSVLLDNMAPAAMREAVALARGRAVVEASGGVDLRSVRGIAETGVELISVGALTHGSAWLDLGLDFQT